MAEDRDDQITKKALLDDRPTGRQAEPLDERAPDELPTYDSEAEAGNAIVSEAEPDDEWKAAHHHGKVNQDNYHPGETRDGLDANEEALRRAAEGETTDRSVRLKDKRDDGPVFDRG